MAVSRRSPAVVWVHNDGPKGELFALNTNGALLATYRIEADVVDLEDLAVGPGPVPRASYLYVGDIGDNDEKRNSLRVYRIPEPPFETVDRARKAQPLEAPETFVLRYPKGSHDAEALLVDPRSGDLFIVTKEKKRARVYGAAATSLGSGQETTLTLVAQLGRALVSGGDFSPDGSEIVLRREDAAWHWFRQPGESVASTLVRPPARIPIVGPPREPNGEAIAFAADGSGYYTLSEGAEQPIYTFRRSSTGRRPETSGAPDPAPGK